MLLPVGTISEETAASAIPEKDTVVLVYRHIMQTLQAENLRIPVCAIGGIELEDVLPLLDTGVQGIAVSGAVLRADDPEEAIRQFLQADSPWE